MSMLPSSGADYSRINEFRHNVLIGASVPRISLVLAEINGINVPAMMIVHSKHNQSLASDMLSKN